MKPELLELLRCPATGSELIVTDAEFKDGEIETGSLASKAGPQRYPIRGGIPRFVPASNYADNFGMQWNRFRATQLDSHSGHPISAQRFWNSTGWKPEELDGRWVLDIGCGAGRFAEVALEAGAHVVALDYSSAVDACYANLRHHTRLHVVQGNVYELPLRPGAFPYVYSLGVLQHTPDVAKAFFALPPMLAPGGQLCVDYYGKTVRSFLHPKYWLRPITKRLPPARLFSILEKWVPTLLPISVKVGSVPLVGRVLRRCVPVINYVGELPLDDRQQLEWSLLDTFDTYAPAYDNPQTARTARRWLEQAGMTDVAVFTAGLLIGRGRKPDRTRS